MKKQRSFRSVYKSTYKKIFALVQRSDSKALGSVILNTSVYFSKHLQLSDLNIHLRRLISLSQPKNPLKIHDAPIINVAIPCHSRDFQNLRMAVLGARHSVKNAIGEIQLITPAECADQLRNLFPDCVVYTDDQVLTAELKNAIARHYPKEKIGWLTQQAIKYRITLLNQCAGTLILDSDTILIQPKVWLDADLNQVLELSHEFHRPYKSHFEKVFEIDTTVLNFVTHYQLMRRDIVAEMFGADGEKLIFWFESGNSSEPSPVSEYDTYGEWMFNSRRKEVRFSKWNNLTYKISVENFDGIREVSNKFPMYASISSHWHLN